MTSNAISIEEYLAELPEDRRAIVQAVREVILANLDPTYQETIQYGMIGYSVPQSIYAAGYHCDPKQPLPFAGLASQKNHVSLYLMCAYQDPEVHGWFAEAKAQGKKLDIGKSCIRFKKLSELPLELVAEAIRRYPASKWIADYESALAETRARKKA
jgi:uncharacterized protein YdhG (YjbR/CyaY superfamily)